MQLTQNSQQTSTKNAILETLSQKWPLTAKEIFNTLKRQHGFNGTYQAVHKTLKLLESQTIIEKNQNKKYNISLSWIKKTQETANLLEKKYSQNPDNQNNSFDSIFDTDMFLIDFVTNNTDTSKNNGEMALQWIHFWIPLMLPFTEYSNIKNILPFYTIYAITKNKTTLDKWCQNFWSKNHIKTKTNTHYESSADLLIFNDYIIQVFYPTEILEKLNSFYNNVKKIKDLDTKYLLEEIFHKKTKIPITITKNQELAQQLIQQTKKYFKKEKK